MAKSSARASMKARAADCRIKKRSIGTRSDEALFGSRFPAKVCPVSRASDVDLARRRRQLCHEHSGPAFCPAMRPANEAENNDISPDRGGHQFETERASAKTAIERPDNS